MPELVRRAVLPGGVAGLVGGVAFGLTMTNLGTLDSIATIVRADPGSGVGWVVHLVIAALVGIVFGLIVWRQRFGAGETMFWGLAYGAFFWFLGPLTLRPLITGGSITWSVQVAQSALPTLLGHLIYGATTGLVFAAIRRGLDEGWGGLWPGHRSVVRGALSGLVAACFFAPTVGGPHALIAPWTSVNGGTGEWAVTLAYGAIAGACYALLYPRPLGRTGASLVRGSTYGFLLWVAVSMTLFPLFDGRGLPWSIEQARVGFATFPPDVLFGVAIAVLYHWASALGRLLFADDPRAHDSEAAGVHGLRALGRGVLAGLVGGALFTPIWLHVDYFGNVAQLVGGSSTGLGVFIHFLIAEAIGALYGLLFARQAYDLGSALGWGISYGFFWWILGVLTLLPIFLGGTVRWNADLAAAAFPGLIGHLVYGSGLGITLYLLECRHNPWWVARTDAEATRRLRRREQVLTSAPALWALTVLVALTIPVLLATKPPPGGGSNGGYGAAPVPARTP